MNEMKRNTRGTNTTKDFPFGRHDSAIWRHDYSSELILCGGAVGVVVSHPLSMREAPGSIPGLSIFVGSSFVSEFLDSGRNVTESFSATQLVLSSSFFAPSPSDHGGILFRPASARAAAHQAGKLSTQHRKQS